MKARQLALFTFFSFLLTFELSAQVISPQLETILKNIRQEYTGQNAYETTHYVSELWRVPGNSGFDSSIYYVKNILEKAGYKESDSSGSSPLSFRFTFLYL